MTKTSGEKIRSRRLDCWNFHPSSAFLNHLKLLLVKLFSFSLLNFNHKIIKNHFSMNIILKLFFKQLNLSFFLINCLHLFKLQHESCTRNYLQFIFSPTRPKITIQHLRRVLRDCQRKSLREMSGFVIREIRCEVVQF